MFVQQQCRAGAPRPMTAPSAADEGKWRQSKPSTLAPGGKAALLQSVKSMVPVSLMMP